MRERLSFRSFLGMMAPPVLYVIILELSEYLTMLLLVLLEVAGIMGGREIAGFAGSGNQIGFLSTAMGALIGIPVFYRMLDRDRMHWPEDFRYEKVSFVKYLYILLLGFMASGGLNQVLGILKVDRFFKGFQEAAQVLYSQKLWLGLFVLGILAPIVEELVFRGLVYERMKRCFSVRTAAVWCSLFFGIYHGNVPQGIYAFLLGLLMVYLREQYQTLLAPVLFHMSANVYSVLASQTTLFDWVFDTPEVFLAVMILEFAVSIVLIWRIQEEVVPKKVKKNREWQNASEENIFR